MAATWLKAIFTFQATFTELLIAATVMTAGAYRFGWHSILAGSTAGTLVVTAL